MCIRDSERGRHTQRRRARRERRLDEIRSGFGCGEAEGRCANRCLLYTSPSPRDRTRYRMPSSA